MLEAAKGEMSTTIYKRCSFIIRENERVSTANALRNNDFKTIG